MNVSEAPALPPRLTQAFTAASSATGIPFGYLVETAARESAFNPSAKASTSSATGLFQFIDSTWLQMVKEEGPQHGLSDAAAAITRRPNGRYVVADPDQRRQVLALRNNPEVSSMMAGEFARNNAAYLQPRLGRAPTSGELYIAHFLGAGGAATLIKAASATPDRSAAAMFPDQASANRPIFYSHGRARSVAEVYAVLTRHSDTPVQPAPQPAMTQPATALAYAEEPHSAPESTPPFDLFGVTGGGPTVATKAADLPPAVPGRFAPDQGVAEANVSRFAPQSHAAEARPQRFAFLFVQQSGQDPGRVE